MLVGYYYTCHSCCGLIVLAHAEKVIQVEKVNNSGRRGVPVVQTNQNKNISLKGFPLPFCWSWVGTQ